MAGLLLILLLVHRPEDAWKVPAIQAVLAGVALGGAYGLIGRTYAIHRLPWRRAWSVLRQGSVLFVSGLAIKGYASSGVVLLGLFATPEAAGLFAAAEKIVRACTGLLKPITQAVYPRMAYVVRQGREQGRHTMQTWLKRTASVGLLLGGGIFVGAPWVVAWALGTEYAEAQELLRILAAVPLLVAFSSAFGLYWMLQLQMDRAFAGITIIAAVGAVAAAAAVVPSYEAVGMAWIVAGAEAFIALAMYGWLRLQHRDPFAPTNILKSVH
jgi:PST family polysaccharide transporter